MRRYGRPVLAGSNQAGVDMARCGHPGQGTCGHAAHRKARMREHSRGKRMAYGTKPDPPNGWPCLRAHFGAKGAHPRKQRSMFSTMLWVSRRTVIFCRRGRRVPPAFVKTHRNRALPRVGEMLQPMMKQPCFPSPIPPSPHTFSTSLWKTASDKTEPIRIEKGRPQLRPSPQKTPFFASPYSRLTSRYKSSSKKCLRLGSNASLKGVLYTRPLRTPMANPLFRS